MISLVRVAAAAVVILGAGLTHGTWTDRWGLSAAERDLIGRFQSVPLEIGDWKGSTVDVSGRERALAGLKACFGAVYTHSATGASVSVLLVGGLPGDIATHSPESCYPGSGYNLSDHSEFVCRYDRNLKSARFKTALATRTGTNPSVLRIIWGWNASKGWSTPADPRWTFASERALSKLYVIRETWGKVVEPADDPCNEFLAALLPQLDGHVFSVHD